MTKAEVYKRLLEEAWTKYNDFASTTAEVAFAEVVKPFLMKRGYTFVAGNGTFFIGDADGEQIDYDKWERSDDEDERAVWAVLDLLIEGTGYDLGTIMPDWKPE